MKNSKVISGIFLFAVLVNLTSLASSKTASREVHISVKFNKSEGFLYYYFNNFQHFRSQSTPKKIVKYENESVREFSIEVINPIFINFVNDGYRSMLYVEPGDTLEIVCFSNAPLKILLNGVYKIEQTFISVLASRGLDILNQDLSFIKLDNKVNPKYLLDELDSLYFKRLSLLNKFADSLGYSKKFINCLDGDFKLLNLISTLRIYADLPESNRPIDLFKPKIDSLSQEIFLKESVTGCNWYLETLYAYYHYKRNLQSTLNHEDKGLLYYDTQKQLPQKQAELIQNFLIRWDCTCFGKGNVEKWIENFSKTCAQK